MAKITLRNLFTKEQHIEILSNYPNDLQAARVYSNMLGDDTSVSRQLARWWRKVFLEFEGKQAAAKREAVAERKLVSPSQKDDIGETSVPVVARRIMTIGDTHAPYVHPDALEFLKHMQASYQPDIVVHMGDEVDNHAISFHDSDPNLDSAGVELEKAKQWMEKLYEIFPNVLVCDSNHGSLVYRRAKAHGLPVQFIKKYRDILFPEHSAPGWSWSEAWVLQTPLGPVRFQHQVSGDFMLNAAHERSSLVLGHEHGRFEVQYAASSEALYFGAYAGCLIDRKALAFEYGRLTRKKPILGCLVITEGCPALIPMLLDDEGRWVGRKK